MMRRRRNWLLFGLGISIVFCLALTDTTMYPLGTLRTVFLQRDGGNTLTGDTFTIANGTNDDFTLQKTDGGAGDLILKTTGAAGSDIILNNGGAGGPRFQQNGTQLAQFASINSPLGSLNAFVTTSIQPVNILGSPTFYKATSAPGDTTIVTITNHTVTGNPSASLWADGYYYQASRIIVQGAYSASPSLATNLGPIVELFSASTSGPGIVAIAGDGGIQSDDPVAIRNTNSAEAVTKFVRGTTVEWRIDSSGDWIDVATGNLVDTVDVGAHTHVGGGSNGAALGTASVGATQLTDTLCLAPVFTSVTTANTAATTYSALGDAGSLLNGTTEATQQVFYLGAVLAHSLRVKVSAAPAGVTSWAITLRDDGVDTALTCTISGAATTCADTSNAPSIGAGSLMTLKIVPAGGVPAATSMYISACTGL